MNSSFPTSFDRPCRPAVGRRGRIVVLCGLVVCGLSRVSPVHSAQNVSASATVTINVTAPPAAQALSVTPQGGSVTAQFAGIPNYPYAVQRATNVAFTLGTNTWFTNAPAGGVFQITDNFSDLGGPPGQAFYRLRYNP
jgi:hypothetical protein